MRFEPALPGSVRNFETGDLMLDSREMLMATSAENRTSTSALEIPKRRVLRKWFMVGFLVVFVGLLLFGRQISLVPSGRAAVETRLWQYYWIQLNQSLRSSGNLGPTTGSGQVAVVTFLEHVFCSVIGGAIVLGVGWATRGKPNRGTESKS
jgi:hypothetical protein